MVIRGRRIRWTGLALAWVVVSTPAALMAREPTRAELEERIRRLERIIEENGLDRPRAERPKGAPPAAAAEVTKPLEPSEVEQIVDDKLKKQKVLAGWKDGFYLESPNGDFRLKVRGYLQADSRWFATEGGDTGTDSFYLRRARPILEGTVFKYFDFRLMPDFGLGTTTIQDAYVEARYFPLARLRAGKFKEPVSLERLQSATDLVFIERSLANNLAPNRDVGLQLAGDFFDGALSYQAGAFNGVVDGGSSDGDITSDKDLAARLFAEPFKQLGQPAIEKLGVGLAGSWGERDDPLTGVNYRTSGRASFFQYNLSGLRPKSTLLGKGDALRYAPQGYWYWGPFGLMGEYIASSQDVEGEVPYKKQKGKKALPGRIYTSDVENTGWFVQASYVLTGEQNGYKGITPINPFDPRLGRWGAFEIAFRASGLDVDDDVFSPLRIADPTKSASDAMAYAGGVNWWLNRNVKIQLNYERTSFPEKIDFGGHDRNHENVVLSRFQLVF
jgi:phosphate-selective porin OprO/OprP